MPNSVYKQIELTGTSKTSLEDAIQTAINRAAKTIHNMRWFVVTEQRGYIEKDAIAYYLATLKVGFTLDD